ncbi:MAG: putative metal-binding motif-containing protein [Alphaproteobacteria bacterium]|nr:putative metal-binding motif-containing protein [Alphaproteobacteria bacterium]
MSSILFLTACFIGPNAFQERVDADGDGYEDAALGGTDCNDGDATIHPGAAEACDGIDSDCDGAEEVLTDADGDGVSVCAGDCDDTDPTTAAGLPELCDAIDNDCDGTVDDGQALATFYTDDDGDGFGQPQGAAPTARACVAPEGFADNGDDCDDTDPDVNPETTWYEDADGDGHGDPASFAAGLCTSPPGAWVISNDDCDDTTALVSPEVNEDVATLRCNGVDDDCDPVSFGDDTDGDGDGYLACADDCDDTDATLTPATPWFLDADEDGYGGTIAQLACLDPSTTGAVYRRRPVGVVADCDDASPSVHPGVDEGVSGACNGVDDDCDPTTYADDIDVDQDGFLACADDCDDTSQAIRPDMTWYADVDGDSFGDGLASPTTGCVGLPASWSTSADDCDDTDPDINPDMYWFHDMDGDGYGIGALVAGCADLPASWSYVSGDCDDTDPDVTPDMTWYADLDHDGYGSGSPSSGCLELPASVDDWSLVGDDCDDGDPLGWIGSREVGLGDDLQALADAACDGVELSLVTGTHAYDPLVLSRDIVVRAATGANPLIVGRVEILDEATLRDVTIEGGNTDRCLTVDGATATLLSVVMEDCAATGDGGGAQVLNGGSLTWTGGSCLECSATGIGGAVHADQADVVLQSLTLAGTVNVGGGSATLEDVVIVSDALEAMLQIGSPTGGSIEGVWLDGPNAGPMPPEGLRLASPVGGSAFPVSHLRVDGARTGVRIDGQRATLGFVTVVGYDQVGIHVQGDKPVTLHDIVVGHPGTGATAAIDIDSAGSPSFDMVYATGASTTPEAGTLVVDPTGAWATCAANTTPFAHCEDGRPTGDLVGPPNDVTVVGGPDSLAGRLSNGALYCPNDTPPTPPNPPPQCFQPGVYGGDGAPTF